MASINDIKKILKNSGLKLSEADLEKLAAAIVSKTAAPGSDFKTNLSDITTVAELSEKLAEQQQAYVEAKREEIKIEEDIARLSGDKESQARLAIRKAEEDLAVRVRALQQFQKEVKKLSEEEQEAGKKREAQLKNELELSAKKLQAQLQINKAQEAGTRIGNNLAKTFYLQTDGLLSQISAVEGVGNQFKVMGGIAKGVGSSMLKAFSPLNLIEGFATKAIESLVEIDKLNYQLFQQSGIEMMASEAAASTIGLESLSIRTTEAAEASMALLNSFQGFRDVNAEARTEMMQTSALLSQMGVSAQDSAEAMTFMVTSLGMTAIKSEETSRELATLALELGRPPAEIISGFNQASDALAKYGPNMQTEFKRLARASKVLNMPVSKLTETFGAQMDTFEGSQKAAASLNAFLGGPYLSGTELLGMTESERIVKLKETLDLQGKSFKQMGKFERMGIAKSLGMSEAELGKLMNANAGDLKGIMADREKQAKTQAELAEKNRKAMDLFTQIAVIMQEVMVEVFGGKEGLFGTDSQGKLTEFKNNFTSFMMGAKKIATVFAKVVSTIYGAFSKVGEAIGGGLEKIGLLSKDGTESMGALVGTIGTIGAAMLALKGPGMILKKVFRRGGGVDGSATTPRWYRRTPRWLRRAPRWMRRGPSGGFRDFDRTRGRRDRRGGRRGRRGRRGAAGGAAAFMAESLVPEGVLDVADTVGDVADVATTAKGKGIKATIKNVGRAIASKGPALAKSAAKLLGGTAAVAAAGYAGFKAGTALYELTQSKEDLKAMENQKLSKSISDFASGDFDGSKRVSKGQGAKFNKEGQSSWRAMTDKQKAGYCDANGRPPPGVGASCGAVYAKVRGPKSKMAKSGTKATMGETSPMKDFLKKNPEMSGRGVLGKMTPEDMERYERNKGSMGVGKAIVRTQRRISLLESKGLRPTRPLDNSIDPENRMEPLKESLNTLSDTMKDFLKKNPEMSGSPYLGKMLPEDIEQYSRDKKLFNESGYAKEELRERIREEEMMKLRPRRPMNTFGTPLPPGSDTAVSSNAGEFLNDASIRLNSSDEVVALKEGGLLDKRLKELISIMSGNSQGGQGGTGTPIVIQMDGKKVAQAVIREINRKYDLSI